MTETYTNFSDGEFDPGWIEALTLNGLYPPALIYTPPDYVRTPTGFCGQIYAPTADFPDVPLDQPNFDLPPVEPFDITIRYSNTYGYSNTPHRTIFGVEILYQDTEGIYYYVAKSIEPPALFK